MIKAFCDICTEEMSMEVNNTEEGIGEFTFLEVKQSLNVQDLSSNMPPTIQKVNLSFCKKCNNKVKKYVDKIKKAV